MSEQAARSPTPELPEHTRPESGSADSLIKHEDSIKYWEEIAPDVDGMLGGYPHVSRVDIQGSRAFLVKCGISVTTAEKPGMRLKRAAVGLEKGKDGVVGEEEAGTEGEGKRKEADERKRLNRVVDCGAGIGRITKDLLISLSTTVDIVEPISKFTASLTSVPGIGQIYNVGLESFAPTAGTTYDLIWNQWCLGHLTDAQLVSYLKNCGSLLTRSGDGKVEGLIVVKENLSPAFDEFDETDSSVTRTEEKFKALFEEAGLGIIRTEWQRGFPKELFVVRMWALKPKV